MEMFEILLALVILIFGFVIIMLINENIKRKKEVNWIESRINKTPNTWEVRRLEENSREQDKKLSLLMDYFDLRYRKIDAHGVLEKTDE